MRQKTDNRPKWKTGKEETGAAGGGPPGSFVLTSFFPEKEKAGGGTGVEALLDLRQGEVREVIREEGEEGAAHEGEIGEGVRARDKTRQVLTLDIGDRFPPLLRVCQGH